MTVAHPGPRTVREFQPIPHPFQATHPNPAGSLARHLSAPASWRQTVDVFEAQLGTPLELMVTPKKIWL